MPQSAYIKLVEGSTQKEITLEEVKQKFERYIEQTGYTGSQLNWSYTDAAFPYTIEEPLEGRGKWFYLKSKDPNRYKGLIVGIGREPAATGDDTTHGASPSGENSEIHYIQIVLPDDAEHGDKSKGNEFSKYLAKQFQAELHLFNGRVMYFYPIK